MNDTEILKETVRLNRERVKNINEEILKPAEKSLSIAKQALAEALCFCKVGDTIHDTKDGEKLIVSKISPSYHDFELRAYKIKKNGEPFKYDSSVYSYSGSWDRWEVIKQIKG